MLGQVPDQHCLLGRDGGGAGWESPQSPTPVVEGQGGRVLLSEPWLSGHPGQHYHGSGSGNCLVLQQQRRTIQILKQFNIK